MVRRLWLFPGSKADSSSSDGPTLTSSRFSRAVLAEPLLPLKPAPCDLPATLQHSARKFEKNELRTCSLQLFANLIGQITHRIKALPFDALCLLIKQLTYVANWRMPRKRNTVLFLSRCSIKSTIMHSMHDMAGLPHIKRMRFALHILSTAQRSTACMTWQGLAVPSQSIPSLLRS